MALGKRSREFEVSDMAEEDDATVHGVVVNLTPVKNSKNNADVSYFTGKLSDGKKVARMISFKLELRDYLQEAKISGSPVAITNCAVKVGKYDPGLEIKVSSITHVGSYVICMHLLLQIITLGTKVTKEVYY